MSSSTLTAMQLLFMILRGLAVVALWPDIARRFVWLSSLFCAFYVLGCGAAPVPMEHAGERIALEHVRPVCWEAPEAKGKDYFVIPDHDGVAIGISEKDLQAVGLQIERIGFIYKYAPDAPADSLRLIPLSRPEAWCTNVPQPTDEKVRQLLEVCPAPEATPQGQGPPAAKNLLGQTNQPVRSTYFCGQTPRLAPTSSELILLRARIVAYQEAYEHARRIALALTQAEADMQRVLHQSDGWLKRALTSDPGSLEQIQKRVTDALNSIEAPEEYEDPILAMLAMKAYAAGFDDGQFEVEAKLFAIDAGIFVIEVVAMEVALGPLGGAKFLASAVSKGGRALSAASARLADIPIFLPTAAGGGGAYIRVGSLLKSMSNYHARKLENALKALGYTKLKTDETHHIVAQAAEKAKEARAILKRFGIDIDHPANGVFLPGNLKSPNPSGAIVHKILGNNKEYYRKVEAFLRDATSQADALQRLRRIGETLKNGTFFHVRL